MHLLVAITYSDYSCIANADGVSEMKQDSDPAPKEPDYPLYVGKYDCRPDDELNFKKGDLMYILHTDNQGWMWARLKETGKEGYILSNYVAEWESLEAEEWFCNITRIEAEELLMLPPNQHGSFLVRNSETSSGGYSLTVRDKEGVQHYRIKKQDNGTFTVSRGATFATIRNLIHYYEQKADGLCCALRYPCLSQNMPQAAGLSKKAHVVNLKAGNMNLEARVKNLETRNTNLEARNTNLEADKKNLEAQVENLEAEKNREISALQQENALLMKAVPTRKEPSSAVKATATQKETSPAVKAATTQKETSSAVKAVPTQKAPSTAVKAAATQKEPSTAVKAAPTQEEPSTAVKAAPTQKKASTAVKAAAAQKEPSTAVEQNSKDIAAEGGDQVIIIADVCYNNNIMLRKLMGFTCYLNIICRETNQSQKK